MIVPNENINDGLEHSYQNEPPGYSEPQELLYFHYEGMLLQSWIYWKLNIIYCEM